MHIHSSDCERYPLYAIAKSGVIISLQHGESGGTGLPKFAYLWKNKSSSLFFKLLTSFAVIILLLVSFNFLSYTFFRTNIQNEVINNNRLNLNTAVNNYEKHIDLVKNLGFNFYFNEKTEIVKSTSPQLNYEMMMQIRRDIQSTLTTPFLYLHNIIYFLKDSSFVIEKEGTSSSSLMFSKFYYNERYSLQFWTEQLRRPVSFKVYPTSVFTEFGPEKPTVKGDFMPILIKNIYNQNFAIIVLLDSRKMYEALQPTGSSRFLILDETRQPLFTSTGGIATADLPLDKMTGSQGFLKVDQRYVFYQKGSETGFTYIHIIPLERIASQIVKLNWILIGLLVISIVIGIAASIFFTIKLNHPLARIVESINQLNAPTAPHSQIKEFNLISDKLHDLLRTNRDIHDDLASKNSVLQYYMYMNKLKMIHDGGNSVKIPMNSDKPYLLVLFQIHMKQAFREQSDMEQNKAMYYIREYVHHHFTRSLQESLTFQIEKDQILSLLFIETGKPFDLEASLQSLKQVFDLDRQFCLITIAVSPQQHETVDLAVAYERVLELAKKRRLADETIIVSADEPEAPGSFALSAAEEQEFIANLSAGNSAAVVSIVSQMHKKRASALQFSEFARDIAGRVTKLLLSMGIEPDGLLGRQTLSEQLMDCYTAEQYNDVFERMLTSAAERNKRKKSEADYITAFVTEYVESHYGEDISLELLADKLNITGAYLSTYFKEKNGINFSDYINAYRMNKAKELLELTNLKIQEISERVGYHNVNSFIRMFKKVTGIPPGEFRTEAAQKAKTLP
jgi:two-component system response regulator YesN